jgi:hypothetical protein
MMRAEFETRGERRVVVSYDRLLMATFHPRPDGAAG